MIFHEKNMNTRTNLITGSHCDEMSEAFSDSATNRRQATSQITDNPVHRRIYTQAPAH